MSKIAKVAIAIVVALLASVFGKMVGGVVSDNLSSRSSTAPQTRISEESAERYFLERSILFSTLKENFPSEYSKILKELTNTINTGPSPENVRARAEQLMANFRRGNASNIMKAPDELLVSLLDDSIEIHALVLNEDGFSRCNSFATVGPSALVTPAGDIPERYLGIIDRQAAKVITAIRAGNDNLASIEEPSDSDWQVILNSMTASGVPDRQLDLLSAKAPSDPEYCDALIALMRAIRNESGDVGRRLRASFVFSIASG